MIQETTISQENSKRKRTITIQDLETFPYLKLKHKQGRFISENSQIAMENLWCSPKFPDNSLTFCKNEGIFQIPWQFPDFNDFTDCCEPCEWGIKLKK